MDEQRANDLLLALSQQRDFFVNQLVYLQADLFALQRKVEELEAAKKEE